MFDYLRERRAGFRADPAQSPERVEVVPDGDGKPKGAGGIAESPSIRAA
ncbi:hypothetical protein [Streptomyces sp. NPDC059552]